jgi:hypothetical protein
MVLQNCKYFDWNHLFHDGFWCPISSILLGFIQRTVGLGFYIISESENHQFQFFEKKFKKKQENGQSWFLQNHDKEPAVLMERRTNYELEVLCPVIWFLNFF